MSFDPNGPLPGFEVLAPEDMQRDLNQCNKMCRQIPQMGRIGRQWTVKCLCGMVHDDDMLQALLNWNRFNILKRITSATKLAALREMSRHQKEQGLR